MRTETIQICKFEELSKEAQEKAIQENRNINTNYDWHEFIIEYWTEKLYDLGFSGVNIRFSGFWSQGDGASFTANDCDFYKIMEQLSLKNKIRPMIYRLIEKGYIHSSIAIKAKNFSPYCHYVHENTTYPEIEFSHNGGENLNEYLDKTMQELENDLDSEIKRINQEIYKSLEKEYEYEISDEAIKETIILNDFEFYEDGTIY